MKNNANIRPENSLTSATVSSILIMNTSKSYNQNNSNYFAPDWAVFTFLALLIYLTVVRFKLRKKFAEMFTAVINYNISRRIFESGNPQYIRLNFFLNLFFCISIGFFLHFTFKHFAINVFEGYLHPIFKSLLLGGVVLVIYLAKYILYRIVGIVVNIQKTVKFYVFNFFLFNRILGIVLFPLVLFLPFILEQWNYIFIWIGIVLGVLFLFILTIRLVKILTNKIPAFFAFMFFIFLEILPFAMIVRVFYNNFILT